MLLEDAVRERLEPLVVSVAEQSMSREIIQDAIAEGTKKASQNAGSHTKMGL